MRRDALRERPCAWCGVLFKAKRLHGVERRFHTWDCAIAAKRAWGVIRPEGAPASDGARRPPVLTGHRVLHVRREEA